MPGRGRKNAAGQPSGNRFGRMEWAGAFGDLGTLIPFVAGYVGVLKMDPIGILFAFGLAMVACGTFYKTPFPVQPMKTIGAIAIAQTAQTVVITPAAVYNAAFVTGLLWLALGWSGAASRIAKIVPRSVVTGIILGLGMSFMVDGVEMMASRWLIGLGGLAVTLLLLSRPRVPTMFLVLLFGGICGMFLQPDVFRELTAAPVDVQAPALAWFELTWDAVFVGTVFLALPQLPLTLGNAVIAIREENNQLFPNRPVTERGVALSTGLMNLAGSAVGGVPMCHGAGGMAGQVAFGARTGGAPIILGTILLGLAIFFSSSIDVLFRLIPDAVLGILLFIAGAQLTLRSFDFNRDRREGFITLATAGFAMWNVGAAFLVGMAGFYIARHID